MNSIVMSNTEIYALTMIFALITTVIVICLKVPDRSIEREIGRLTEARKISVERIQCARQSNELGMNDIIRRHEDLILEIDAVMGSLHSSEIPVRA